MPDMRQVINQSSAPSSEAEEPSGVPDEAQSASPDPSEPSAPVPPNRRFLGEVGRARLYVTRGDKRPLDLAVDAFVISTDFEANLSGALANHAREVLSDVWDGFEATVQSTRGERTLVPETPIFVPVSPLGRPPLTLVAATPWVARAERATLEGVQRAVRAVIGRAERRSLRRVAIPALGARGGGLPPVQVVRSVLAAAKSALPAARQIRELTVVVQEKDGYEEAIALFSRVPQRFANDLPGGEDLLDVSSEIQALTDVLLLKSLQPPLAVGILGGWGSGKSFAMDLMRRHIQRIRSLLMPDGWRDQGAGAYVGHIYPITFDAWTYAKSNLWASLMQTIFLELSRQVHLEKRIREYLKKTSLSPELEGRLWELLQGVSDRDREAVLDQDGLTDHLAALSQPVDQLDSEAGKALWDAVANLREEHQTALKEKEAEAARKAAQIEEKKATLAQQVDQELEDKAYKMAWTGASKSLQKLILSVVKQAPGGNQAVEEGKAVQEFLKVAGADARAVPMGFRNLLDAIRRNPVVVGGALLTAAVVAGLALWLRSIDQGPGAAVTWVGSALTLLAGLARTASNWRAQVVNAWKGLATEVRTAESRVEHEREVLLQKKLQDPELEKDEESRRRLDSEIQRLRQQIGFTADYVSVADLVQARLRKADYEGELGLLHRVQRDLEELSLALCLPDNHPLRSRLEEQFPRGPARIVLFIDDLDRCPPDRVVEVLEAVQLLVKTPLFVVVVAMDVRYITRALEKVYKDILLRHGNPCGLDYIEKIIQLPYSVRPIDSAFVERFLRGQMEVQAEEDGTPGSASLPSATTPGQAPASPVSTEETEPITDEVVIFSAVELGWIKCCCEQLPLSPRAVKRVVNALKLLKIVWFRPNRHQRPDPDVQEAFVALLALSAAYPKGMRLVFGDLSRSVQDSGAPVLLRATFETLLVPLRDQLAEEELQGLEKKSDLIPDGAQISSDLWATLELVRSLSFVAEIGYDPADERAHPEATC